jgi:hypothetical protein
MAEIPGIPRIPRILSREKLTQQPDGGMPADATPKEPTVRGNERAIQCDRQRQVDAIPKRHLIVERQIQCASRSGATNESSPSAC